MARGGTFRSVVLPTAVNLAVVAALLYCSYRALLETRFADDLGGGFGAVGAGLGISVLTGVAERRHRRRARELLPSGLTEVQRDHVIAGARSGPVPDDPAVRLEARRLAEQWTAGRGSDQRNAGIVVAVLAVACAIAGAVASPWWWADAVLLSGMAVLVVRRTRQRARHLAELRAGTVLPEPPPHGVHRLVDTEPLPDPSESDRGLLELRIRRPWGGETSASSTMVRINGVPVAAEWGTNRYLVPAGQIAVRVWIDYLFDYGHAGTTATVPAGQVTVLHYSQPALTFLGGRIGPERQRGAGAVAMTVVAVVFVVAIVSLIVLFP